MTKDVSVVASAHSATKPPPVSLRDDHDDKGGAAERPKLQLKILFSAAVLKLAAFANTHPLLEPGVFFLQLDHWDALLYWRQFAAGNFHEMSEARCTEALQLKHPPIFTQLKNPDTHLLRVAMVLDARDIPMFRLACRADQALPFSSAKFYASRAAMYQVGTPPFRWNIGFAVGRGALPSYA